MGGLEDKKTLLYLMSIRTFRLKNRPFVIAFKVMVLTKRKKRGGRPAYHFIN